MAKPAHILKNAHGDALFDAIKAACIKEIICPEKDKWTPGHEQHYTLFIALYEYGICDDMKHDRNFIEITDAVMDMLESVQRGALDGPYVRDRIPILHKLDEILTRTFPRKECNPSNK